LKHLDVGCQANFDSLIALLDDVKIRCLKLKTLTVCILLSRDNTPNALPVSDTDEILDHILASREKIQAIVEKCRPLVSKLKIISYLQLLYISGDELTCDWVERVKTLDLFKDSIHQNRIEHMHGLWVYICKLDSKFSDGFLELKHSTTLYRVIQQ